jgi:hypothetical protein
VKLKPLNNKLIKITEGRAPDHWTHDFLWRSSRWKRNLWIYLKFEPLYCKVLDFHECQAIGHITSGVHWRSRCWTFKICWFPWKLKQWTAKFLISLKVKALDIEQMDSTNIWGTGNSKLLDFLAHWSSGQQNHELISTDNKSSRRKKCWTPN